MEVPRRQPNQHHSLETRRLMVYQHEVLKYTSMQIAVVLDTSERTVQRYLKRWRELGDVISDPSRAGRPKIMSTVHLDYVVRALAQSPDLYLDEIAEELYYRHGIEVSLPTLIRNMKEVGLTNKKLSKRAAERSEEKRLNYILQVMHEPAERLVFADESAVNLLTTFRLNGWAPKGQRAFVSSDFARGEKFSILPALSLEGILHCAIAAGSFNGNLFMDFVQGLLENMRPYPDKHSVLIIDNCGIHHVEGVQELCDAKGVKLIYLSPYSPDFNPIEEMFSSLKASIRRNGAKFRRIVKTKDRLMLSMFINEILASVTTPSNIQGWFRKYL